MTLYVIILVLLLILTLTNFAKVRGNEVLLYIILLFLSFFLVGCRHYVGADWYNYVQFYNDGYDLTTLEGTQEPLFTIFRNIIYKCGFSHGVFFGVLTFLSLLLIVKASKLMNVKNYYFVLSVYFALFFFSYQFNIYRTGLMASCFILARAYLSIGNKKDAFLWSIIGCGFHLSGILFVLSLFVLDKILNKK